jgi:hypothetical protein
MLSAIAAAKKKNDQTDASKIERSYTSEASLFPTTSGRELYGH